MAMIFVPFPFGATQKTSFTGVPMAMDTMIKWLPDRRVSCTCHVRSAMALQGFGAARLIRDTVVRDIRDGCLVRLAQELGVGVVAIHLLARDPQPVSPVLVFRRMVGEGRAERTPKPLIHHMGPVYRL